MLIIDFFFSFLSIHLHNWEGVGCVGEGKKSMLLLFLKYLHFKRILASYVQRSLNGGMRSSKEDGSEYFVFFSSLFSLFFFFLFHAT